MRTLKFKTLRQVIKLRNFCATADGEKTMCQIFTIWSFMFLSVLTLLVIGELWTA